jgi:hypothetical protein
MTAPFIHLTQTLNESIEPVGGVSSYVYNFFSAFAGTTSNTITANLETELCEVRFDFPGSLPAELRLASLPDGGTSTTGFLNMEVGGTNITNATALTYGTGATNSASGFSGLSFVPVNIVLPVKFLSFIALKSGDDAKLSWTVENDADNRYFELERSKDGREFKAFAKIDALGNGKAVNTYSLTDVRISNVGSKVVYYRVKQVDKDGTITYSNIRNLGIERNGIAVSIYPNPARSITKLVFDAEKAGRGNVLIRDMNGKLVQQVASQFIAGVNQQELNVSNLAAGEYNVTITGTGFDHTLKLTKVN